MEIELIDNMNGTTILFVDDEPDVEVLMKQRFRKQIKEKRFTLLFAHNGLEAIEVLTKEPTIRMVVSDINMPEMDGLTLLKEISNKFPNVIPIIVSAYGDMNNIRAAMNLGAFDFVTKPINFDDLNLTLDKTLSHIQRLLDAQKTKYRLEGILHELNVASQIQQSILPQEFIQNDKVDLYAQMIAAKEIGGDFYDFFWIDADRTKLAIVIADVSGKGVPAALFMTVTRTLLRAHANTFPDNPGDCLSHVNATLQKDNTNMMFVTTFYAILDTTTGILTYSNAGHNPPFIVRSNGTTEAISKAHGMALGVREDLRYGMDQLKIEPNDLLFMYTDGVTEAENASNGLLGEEKLTALLRTNCHLASNELINTIKSEITTFAAGTAQSDDITMLALRFVPGNKT